MGRRNYKVGEEQISNFKKLNKPNYNLPSSYRPISLTSVVAKLMERIITYRLEGFVEMNNIMDQEQEGFRQLRGTTSALLSLTQAIFIGFNKEKTTIVIFIDFEKAYDSVWREEKQTKTDTNNINEETSEISQNLNPSKPNIDNNNNAADTPAQTEVNLSRLQQCFLDTICKLQISQERDTTTILEAINGCRILLLQGQSQLDHKSTDKDTLSKELQSVQQKIKTLQEEKDSLKSQLQIEKGNVTLLKCQYDDLNNHSRNLLEETRKELEKLVSCTNTS
ncbi:unnamed protein product [Mytilus coruscus]|uniref:Reverse transcriptase domain-containing protein n=1 Tax=Mytilus coruscus TaxID=42192 RepID=A0A6J8C168_MYTCO|nr:unnamed protein product [Mytilus coruscus]